MTKKKPKSKKSSKKAPKSGFNPIVGVGIAAVVVIALFLAFANKGTEEVIIPEKTVDTTPVVEEIIEEPEEVLEACGGEGYMAPSNPDALSCCDGLELIDPKQATPKGFAGFCTAGCGDGICNPNVESQTNCPADCEFDSNARPVCDGIGTEKEGWYQNDKILKYEYCNGCSANCKGIGWYNDCDDKYIKSASC